MSSRIVREAPHLRTLRRANSRRRKELLRQARPELIHALSECALNTLNGNVPLNRTQVKKLGRHRKTLRMLANRKHPLSKKRIVLIQKGGSLIPLLLGPIIGAVSSLFGR